MTLMGIMIAYRSANSRSVTSFTCLPTGTNAYSLSFLLGGEPRGLTRMRGQVKGATEELRSRRLTRQRQHGL